MPDTDEPTPDTTYHCESCGKSLSRDEYVAVGPITPAAKQLGIEDPGRDHLVACNDCFERACAEINGRTQESIENE